MAIGPNALEQLRTKADGEKVKKLEDKIDDFLKKNYKGQAVMHYTLKNYLPKQREQFEELIEKYRDAGFSSVSIVKRRQYSTYGYDDNYGYTSYYAIRFENKPIQKKVK